MALAHRIGDFRSCGATTVPNPAVGSLSQSFVKVNGAAWAVQGDISSHGAGAFQTVTTNWIKINGVPVVVVGDTALPDSLCYTLGGAHCAPVASSGSLINIGS